MPLSISRFCAFRKAQKHNSLFLIPKLPIFKEKHFICLSEIWTVSPFYVVCRICLKKRNHFKSFELKCFIGPPSWLVKFADMSLLHRKKNYKSSNQNSNKYLASKWWSLDPKMAREKGSVWTRCGFLKNVYSKDSLESCFFVTFNIIIKSHLSWKIHWNSSRGRFRKYENFFCQY